MKSSGKFMPAASCRTAAWRVRASALIQRAAHGMTWSATRPRRRRWNAAASFSFMSFKRLGPCGYATPRGLAQTD
jgi:hypothetical protein